MSNHFDIAISDGLEWVVNGNPVEEDVGEFLSEESYCTIVDKCPYCNVSLRALPFKDIDEDTDNWHLDRNYMSLRCERCGFWQFKGNEAGNKCMDAQQSILFSSVAAKFAPSLPNGCSHELAQYLRRHPTHWHDMKPKDLELLVADIFRANYHGAEVIHVGKPHDRGIDVIFIEANKTKWLIQAKRRVNPRKKEGFETLQNILGAMALDGARHGIVVSTSDAFSYFAERGRKDAAQNGFCVELLDKGKLDRMITPLIPEIPWGDIFNRGELQHISIDVKRHFGGHFCDGQLPLPI